MLGSFVGGPLFVARCVQHDQRKDVNVPHAVDAGEERRGELQIDGLVPFPSALGHLADNEADYGEGGAEQGGQHEELKAIDDAFVVETPGGGH